MLYFAMSVLPSGVVASMVFSLLMERPRFCV